jgi:hypothetical protein
MPRSASGLLVIKVVFSLHVLDLFRRACVRKNLFSFEHFKTKFFGSDVQKKNVGYSICHAKRRAAFDMQQFLAVSDV